jgi:hypothetical protein
MLMECELSHCFELMREGFEGGELFRKETDDEIVRAMFAAGGIVRILVLLLDGDETENHEERLALGMAERRRWHKTRRRRMPSYIR